MNFRKKSSRRYFNIDKNEACLYRDPKKQVKEMMNYILDMIYYFALQLYGQWMNNIKALQKVLYLIFMSYWTKIIQDLKNDKKNLRGALICASWVSLKKFLRELLFPHLF